jgi:RsiW-degrading membrane proteinase PrsW (M82 family)
MLYIVMSGSLVLLIILLVSSLPVFIVYAWFRIAKYKFSSVWFLFALLTGIAAFFPALILQDFLNFSFASRGRGEIFYHVFFRIAFTEEFSRLLMLIIFFIINNFTVKQSLVNRTGDASLINTKMPPTFNIIKKATATGLVAGLGFAILENSVYAAFDTRVLLLRAVTAAPIHAACGSRVGSASVMFRTNPIQAFVRLITATAIHGIYNFMVAIPGFSSIMAVLIALTALASSIAAIHGGWEKPQNDLDNFGIN